MPEACNELEAALLTALGDSDCDGVAAAVSALVAQVTARWPAWVGAGAFAAYVVARIEPGAPAAGELSELHAGDLYLACACAANVPAAIAELERGYIAALPSAIRSIDATPHFVDDVVQLVRERMLVAVDGGTRRLEAYSGHGPLGAFLRVTAIRLALSERRRKGPPTGDDAELATLIDDRAAPDLKMIAARLGADLRVALRAAIASQPARIRSALQMYYADGRGVEDIGRVYRVHASSVSRWLTRARTEILAATRANLIESLAASESDVDSLLGHAASMEISFGSALRSD